GWRRLAPPRPPNAIRGSCRLAPSAARGPQRGWRVSKNAARRVRAFGRRQAQSIYFFFSRPRALSRARARQPLRARFFTPLLPIRPHVRRWLPVRSHPECPPLRGARGGRNFSKRAPAALRATGSWMAGLFAPAFLQQRDYGGGRFFDRAAAY